MSPKEDVSFDLARMARRLRADDLAVRVHAAIVLSELGQSANAIEPDLIEALNDADADIVRIAAWVLGYVGGPKSLVALRAFQHPNEQVERMAKASVRLLQRSHTLAA